MTNSVAPDQTALIGAVCPGSTLFASILKLVSNVKQFFAADDFSRCHFSDAFFLGALRINSASVRPDYLWKQFGPLKFSKKNLFASQWAITMYQGDFMLKFSFSLSEHYK